MSVNRVVRVLPVLVLAASCFAGCGSDASSPRADSSAGGSPSPAGSAPAGAPRCDTVWQDGSRIPGGYRGCVQDGSYVPRDVLGCSSGQRMVRYADRFYGVLGGTVHEVTSPLDHDRDYLAAVRRCRA